MHISARVLNTSSSHSATVSTDGRTHSLEIAAKVGGRGSAVNGGELLFAALATCFCNDVFREATHRGILVRDVEVEVSGAFDGPGDPARDITYRVRIDGDAPRSVLEELVRATDRVAEIHNTLRGGCAVTLAEID